MRRWLLTATACACLPWAAIWASTASGDDVPPPTTRPATESAPSTQPATRQAPASQPSTQPAPKPAPKPVPRSERTVQFQFAGIPYSDAVRWFAQKAGKPILGDIAIPGELTFADKTPYTYEDAFETLNLLLAMKGFWLVETDRYFRVVAVTQVPNQTTILSGLAEMEKVRPGEVVTVVIPLQQMDSETASKSVVRMVSTWGSISPLSKGNGIVITDSARNIRRIQEFLRIVDAKSSAEKVIDTYPLKRASASTVTGIIDKLFDAQSQSYTRDPKTGRLRLVKSSPTDETVTATADERTNSIILMGRSDRVAMAREMVQKLDGGPGEDQAEGGDVRVFVLKNAKAEELAKVLLQAVGGSRVPAVSYRHPSAPPSSSSSSVPVRIVADPATNNLIVSAPADKMAVIEKLILQLDTASTAGGAAKIVRLKSSDAEQLAAVVTSVLTSRSSYDRARTGVQIAADSRTNSLVLNGSAGDVQVAVKLIEELDKEEGKDAREIHVLQLKVGSAGKIAESLTAMFSREVPGMYGRSATKSMIRVESDDATNTLMISAPPAEWQKVQKFLDQLVAAAEARPAAITRRYVLQHTKADELAQTLREIHGGSSSRGYTSYPDYSGYSRRGRPSRSGEATSVAVNIAVDRNSNTLIVSASEADQTSIADMIEALDVAATADVAPIRMIELKNADAAKLAQTLQAMLPPVPYGQKSEVALSVDAQTNTLIIRAPESQRKMLEEMIASLDKPTKAGARETRIIPLKHVSARGLVPMLTQLYSAESLSRPMGYSPYNEYSGHSRRRSFASGTDSDRVVISSAPGDRALVVDAPKQKIEEIAQLVASLDTEDAPGKITVRAYDMGKNKAAEVVGTLTRLFGAPRHSDTGLAGTAQPRFETNAATNQILVAATASQHAEIEKVIEGLKEVTQFASETRTFKLKFAKASDLAEVLQQMLAESASSSRRRGYYSQYSPVSSPATPDTVRVAAMEESNSIVVQGPPEKLALAEKLITTFDVPEAVGNAAIVRLPLTRARAETLVATLRKMLPAAQEGRDQEIFIEAEKSTNSILLRAPQAQRQKLETIIAQLDNEAVDSTREVRIIPLKHASAGAMAIMFGRLYSSTKARPSSNGYGYSRPRLSSEADEGVTVTAAPGDRSLVVEAPRTKMADVVKLIASLDVEDASGNIEVRTYQIANSKASEMALSLSGLFAERERASVGTDQTKLKPRFEADVPTNQLMVAATAEQFEEIEKVITKLQAATTLAIQTKAFPLKHARANDLAGVLETMLAESGGSSRRSYDPYASSRRSSSRSAGVRVASVPAANTIVVQGPPEKLALAEKLIIGFDTPDAAGQATVRLVPLVSANATSLAALLTKMLPADADGEPRIQIQAEPMTNTVLVRAPEAQRKMIEDMIAKLDQATQEQVREMRIVPVKHVSAEALAEKLAELFPSDSSAKRSTAPSYNPYDAYDPYGRSRRTRTVTPDGDNAKRVVITSAPNDKALIIDAPKARIDDIVATVAKLDVEDLNASQQVRVYQLSAAKAEDLVSSLSKMFTSQRSEFGRSRKQPVSMAPEPRFDADAATNQLLVSATAEQFEQIEKVIQQVQKGTGLASQTKTFPLKFARAEDLAEMLQTMLGQSSSSSSLRSETPWGTGRSSSRQSGGSLTVRVAAMPNANSLVVQAPPEKMLLAEQLIAQFDTDKPGRQIVIEIVRLENAQAPSLADAINATLAAREPSAARRTARDAESPVVSVTAEVNSNSILVRGPADEVKNVVEMIRRLDQQGTSSTVQVRVFKLENSSAADLEKSVGQLFGDMTRRSATRLGAGRRSPDPVPFSISADERTNSLIVSTTAASFKIVENILAQLDKASSPREVAYLYLNRADPDEVATIIEAMYADRKGAAKPIVEPDYYSQAISVVAKEADLKAIEDVIAKLDDRPVEDEHPIVRVVPLTQIRASRMAELLQRMYGQMGNAEVIVTDKLPEDRDDRIDANTLDANSVRIFPGLPNDVEMLYTRIEMPPAIGAASSLAAQPAAKTPPAVDGDRPATTQPATTRPAESSAGRTKITIAVDRTSNSLILLAPRQELENIQSLIDQLSATAGDADFELRVVRVQHASPAAIADTLDALFNPRSRASAASGAIRAAVARSSRGREPRAAPELPTPTPAPIGSSQVTVVADIRTKSVIVRAKPSDFDLILPLVKELDRVSTVVSEVRIFTLKNTDAAEVAENLTDLFTPSKKSSPTPSPVSRSSRSRTSSRQDQTEMILQMLQMSGQGAAGATKVDAGTLVSISANKNTNSVIVSAPAEAMTLIQRVIEDLDKATSFTRAVRMYPLKHAEVGPTVQALREVFPANAAARRTTTRTSAVSRAASGMDEPIIISGNEAGRLILVSAPDERHELVAKVIKDLDDAQATGEVTVKVYRLENADASTLSRALAETLQVGGTTSATSRGRRGSTGADTGQPRISADTSSNALVVRATKEDHARIVELLAQLDQSRNEKYPVRSITLKHADADSVSRVLGGLFGGSGSGAGATSPRGRTRSSSTRSSTAKGSVVIEPDAASRMILIRADDATFAKIQEIVAKLDVVTAAKAAPEILTLKYANAAEVAPSLQAAFGTNTGVARRVARSVDSVSIVAEPLTNSLIVTANAENLDKVKALVAKFDTEKAIGAVTQVLQLGSATAADIANVLSRSASGGSGATRSRGRATVVAPQGQQIVVSSEPSSNTIIVTGPAKEVIRLIAMAEQLDKAAASAANPTVRMYPVKNADIPTMVLALQQIFANGNTYSRRSGGAYRRSAGGASEPAVAIIGDEVSGRIIVSAAAERHTLIAKTIKEMDETNPAEQVVVKVYQIENADATTLANALTTSLTNVSARGRSSRSSATSEAKRLRIIPDSGSNTLVVRGTAQDHEQIARLIAEMDVGATDKYPVQTIALNNANATEVATVLNGVFGPAGAASPRSRRTPRSGRSSAGSGSVVIQADASSRMLLVRADPDTFEKIRELATKLDTASTGSSARTLIALVNADASAIAVAIGQAFAPQRGQRLSPEDVVTVVAETNSNSIIVTANATNLDKVKTLVASLDTDTGGARTELLVLQHAKAADLAPVLSQAAGGVVAQRGRSRVPSGGQSLTVSADAASNALVITGSSAKVDKVLKMALALDKASEASAVPVVKMYDVKNADVETLAQSLQQIFAGTSASRSARGRTSSEAPIVILPAESGRKLVVSAPADKHELIAKVITDYDESATGDQVIVKVYKIENADATSVAAALTASLNAKTTSVRGRAPVSGGQVRITADRSSGTLIVRAPISEHERIAQLIKEIDVSTVLQYPVQMIPLTIADAETVAAMLNKVFVGGSAASRGRGARAPSGAGQGKILIEADKDSRLIVVRADAETFQKIRTLASQLDVPTGKAAQTLLTLKHAKAEMVAASLAQAFAPQRGVRISPDDMVSVVAESGTNSIIVTANAPNLDRVKALLAQLDVADAGTRTQLLLLKYAKASQLATVLASAASAGATAPRRGRSSAFGATTDQGVTISADEASNALIITGPTGKIDDVIAMAMQLDQAAESTASTVKIIQLKNGDAAGVAAMIRDMYAQQQQAARANRQTITPLAVTADERANALVVSTNSEMHEKVAKWVSEIEQMNPARGTMRLIQLKNVDPTEVERAIQQLYNTPGTRGPSGVRAPAGRKGSTRASASAGGGRVETSVLEQQRSILINASDEDFEAIQALAKALDEAAAVTKQSVQVFVLKNANNIRVAAAITSMYRGTAVRGATQRPEDNVTVTALAMTNAVVVSAATEKMAEVAHLIEQLDKKDVAPQLEFRIYTLKNEMPTKIMPALQQLLTQIKRLRPDETIDVQADERTRSIIVTAKGTVFEQVEKVIETLDKPAANVAADVMVIQLKRADATRLAAVLMDMIRPSAQNQITPEARALQDQIRLLRLRGGTDANLPELDLAKPIKISADPVASGQQGSNALVIVSTPENLKALAAIVETLDAVPLAEAAKVRLVHLKNADAASVAAILVDVFKQGQKLAGAPKSSVVGRAVPDSASGKALVNPLNVSADTRTNTLVLSGLEESLALAELIVKDLDRQEGKIVTEVRLFKLRNADATKLLPMLQAVFAESPAGAAASGAEGLRTQVTRLRTALADKLPKETEFAKTRPALTVQADALTNILIVAARSDVMPLIAEVVNSLDIPGAGSLSRVRIFPLANADAAGVQQVLVALHTGPNAALIRAEDRPTVAIDARTNSLIVSASEKTLGVIETLLKRLDVKATIEMHSVRLLTLENADALTLAPTLQKMLDARVQRATALGQVDAERLRMLVAADTRSNSLIVGGSADGFELVKSLAQQLDAVGPALGGEIQILPLKRANAGTMSVTLVNLFNARYQAARTPDVARQKPVILPDLRINALLVSAGTDDSKVLLGLVAKLDVEITDPAVVIEVLPLTHNDAGAIGPVIQQIFQARLTSMTPPGATPSPQDRVDVAADALANALIVSASKENLAMIRELLKKVDVEPATESGTVKIYTLKNADAQQASTMLQSLVQQGLYKPGASFVAQNNPAVAAREKVAISVDARTNSLIVSASKENLLVIDKIVLSLDGDKIIPAMQFKVFKLANATATVISPTLQQLFTQRVSRETTKDPMTVIADSRTNSLIVGASPTDMKLAETLIAQLDAAPGKDSTMTALPLKKADAKQVAETLKTLLTGQGGTGAGAAGATNISVDERTNTILVSAGAADLKRIKDLVEQLDREQLTNVTEIRVFPLQHADSTELAQILTDVLTNKPQSPTPLSPNRQTLLQFISKTTDGKELIATALQEGVVITADRRSNAVIVAAPVKNMPLLDSLVHALDSISPRMAEIRVFTLVNADAGRMSEVLTQLLGLSSGQQAAKAVSYTLVTSQPASTAQKGPSATVGSSEQDALSVTVDLRTNSLLIGGTKRYVELASKVIQDLDSSPAQERMTKVYRLRNAQAPAIQTAMQTFLDQEKQRLTSTLGANGMGAAQRLLEREVAVVAEETSNVLLLSASPRYFDTIEALIKELDQPPPQVLIQALLAEVTLDETNELGIDWNVTSKWNKGHDSISAGTQIAVAAAGDGFNLSVAAGDLSFFLRALQSQGRLEILSRPQILASDNQQATINVGQRVPFITNSRVTENGTTINTIQYENVGIILTVTPRINPDGFVKLEVKPEISSLASSSVTISETTKAIVINQRSAETTVTVQDGHTIIIGGLITTKDDDREDRIPWFGDMPWLGALFRGTKKVKERSELLIILTPHVLRTIPEADVVTDTHIDRVNRIRHLKRNEVEDYLKKHLDKVMSPNAMQDKSGISYPTSKPVSQPLIVPVRPSARSVPLPTMPRIKRPDEVTNDEPEVSWQRVQEQFQAALAVHRIQRESAR